MPAMDASSLVRQGLWEIVAVDFGGIGSGIPLHRLLAGVDDPTRRARVVNPLDTSWRSDADSLPGNAAAAADRLLAGGLGRAAVVLAQCTGAAFALALAGSLTRSSAAPRAVALVHPVLVTPGFVAAHVHQLVTQLGGEAAVAGRISAGLPSGGLSAVSRYVDAELRVVAQGRIASLGLDPVEEQTVVAEIVGRYVDWTGFLTAQLAGDPADPGCAVHLLGRDVEPMDARLRLAGIDAVPAARFADAAGDEVCRVFAGA